MQLTLKRRITANGAVIGDLLGLSKRLFVLEDEWRGNQRGISCIPAGFYQVKPHGWEPDTSLKYRQVWQLQKVSGRTGILIHAGNTHRDTEGCLLVGMGMQISQLSSMVTDSRMALDLMRKEIGESDFTIMIEGYGD